jgi:hypothetical protein
LLLQTGKIISHKHLEKSSVINASVNLIWEWEGSPK